MKWAHMWLFLIKTRSVTKSVTNRANTNAFKVPLISTVHKIGGNWWTYKDMRYTYHGRLLSYKKDKVLLNHWNMGRLKHIILSQDRYSLIRACNIKTNIGFNKCRKSSVTGGQEGLRQKVWNYSLKGEIFWVAGWQNMRIICWVF